MRALGMGHTEHVYHSALITALHRQGVQIRSEVICPIYFMGDIVAFGKADLVIDNLVLELKAVTRPPTTANGQQLQKYLQSLQNLEGREFHGMVVNFNQTTGKIDTLAVQCVPPATRTVVSGAFRRSLGEPKPRARRRVIDLSE